MTPSSLTQKLQPLDISINKEFKENLRSKYAKYCMRIANLNLLRTLSSNGEWNIIFRLYYYQWNDFKFI